MRKVFSFGQLRFWKFREAAWRHGGFIRTWEKISSNTSTRFFF